MLNAGVVVFPGSNCDQDMVRALQRLGVKVVKLWHKEADLQGVDLVVLPGGFSYGDYLRTGAVARFSPIMNSVIAHANAGKPLLGVCNGFQILCEAHLLPGVLVRNDSLHFNCSNVYLKPATRNTAITADLDPAMALKIPIAHGEGRFIAAQPVIDELVAGDQIIFKYCDADGDETADSNPNGSTLNIAGITNSGRNIFGLMPHPERAADDLLHNTDGALILQSLINNVLQLA